MKPDANAVAACAAQLAHEANRMYRIAIMKESNVPDWTFMTHAQRTRFIRAASSALEFERTPEKQHEAWMTARLAEGWKLGDEISESAKTHPNLRPYDELTEEQRQKDVLYLGIMAAWRPLWRAARGA